MDIMEEVVIQKVEQFTASDEDASEWNMRGLADWVNLNFPLGMPEEEIVKAANSGGDEPVAGSLYHGLNAAQFAVCRFISDAVRKAYELKISFEQADALKAVERYTILTAIDKLWQEHLYGMDSLRNSIGLRAYGQRDPLIEYKAEAFKVFEELMVNIKTEICHNIFRSASSMMAFENFLRNVPQKTMHQSTSAFEGGGASATDSAPGKAATWSAKRRRRWRRPNPFAPARKLAATTRVPAAAGKNTNIAAGACSDTEAWRKRSRAAGQCADAPDITIGPLTGLPPYFILLR